MTDADGDGLIDQFEQLFGTDTTKADTDGDGLSDAYETSVSHTDALSMDTDRDGLTDAARAGHGQRSRARRGAGRGPRRRVRRARDAGQRLRRGQRSPGAEGGHERRWTPTPTATAQRRRRSGQRQQRAIDGQRSRRPDRQVRVGVRHPGARPQAGVPGGAALDPRGIGPRAGPGAGGAGPTLRRVPTRWPRGARRRPEPRRPGPLGAHDGHASARRRSTRCCCRAGSARTTRMMTAIAQAESSRNPARSATSRCRTAWGPFGGAVPGPHPQGGDRHGQRPRHPAPAQQPRRAGARRR